MKIPCDASVALFVDALEFVYLRDMVPRQAGTKEVLGAVSKLLSPFLTRGFETELIKPWRLMTRVCSGQVIHYRIPTVQRKAEWGEDVYLQHVIDRVRDVEAFVVGMLADSAQVEYRRATDSLVDMLQKDINEYQQFRKSQDKQQEEQQKFDAEAAEKRRANKATAKPSKSLSPIFKEDQHD